MYTNADLKISADIFVFLLKWYAEDFKLKYLLLFEICARVICEMFVYKRYAHVWFVKSLFTNNKKQ